MTHRPTPAAHDPSLLHTSTRTSMSTNAVPDVGRARVTFRVTKLEIRWIDGDVAMRFTDNAMDVTPRARSPRTAR